MGYPSILDGPRCLVGHATHNWFSDVSADLNVMIEEVAEANSSVGSPEVFFVDVAEEFVGHSACDSDPAIHKIVTVATPGESGLIEVHGEHWTASQQSVHPNYFGTDLYRDALEEALRNLP